MAAFCILGGGDTAFAQTVRDVQARQRWPWNNLVDIDYTIEGVADTEGLYIRFEVSDPAAGWTKEAAAFDREPPLSEGTHRVTWAPEADGIRLQWSDGVVCRAVLKRDDPKRYLVIDLSGDSGAADYPVSYLPAPPAGGWTDEYKTTKLAMRKIDPGTFMMGSPKNEAGRNDEREDQHQVTLTKPFYIGIFQVTQKQWKQVMRKDPSQFKGNMRPVEKVSYTDIRGASADMNWPDSSGVDEESFTGRIRTKTGLLAFDLPTDAQWEYACRAGAEGPWNVDGKQLSDLGRYKSNQSDGKGRVTANHTIVGSYLPNAWGLYDMHGNVWELCLDWFEAGLGAAAVTDPQGPASGSNRVMRGGSWGHDSDSCRSACRYFRAPADRDNHIGFRPVCSAGPRTE